MNDISKRILQLFEENGASYGEVSDKTGIPKSALHRYATGETPKIPINRIEKIAKYFNVTAAYIMGWETKEPPAATDGPEGIRNELHQIINELTDEQVAEARLYVDFLKNKGN